MEGRHEDRPQVLGLRFVFRGLKFIDRFFGFGVVTVCEYRAFRLLAYRVSDQALGLRRF